MHTNLWNGCWNGSQPVGDSHRRAREVISPSGGIMRGKFPSRKNGRLVHCEGMLELDAAYLFEASPCVTRYREQPTSITYPDDGRIRRYTPDFELTLTTGQVVWVEIKPTSSLLMDEVRRKLSAIREHMRRRERAFDLLSDETLRQEPRRSNVRTILHRASKTPPTVDAALAALRRCAERLPAPLCEISTWLAASGMQPYSLMLMDLLRFELSTPLTPDTLITVTKENDDAWFRLSEKFDF